MRSSLRCTARERSAYVKLDRSQHVPRPLKLRLGEKTTTEFEVSISDDGVVEQVEGVEITVHQQPYYWGDYFNQGGYKFRENGGVTGVEMSRRHPGTARAPACLSPTPSGAQFLVTSSKSLWPKS
jgi:hypothetical protein